MDARSKAKLQLMQSECRCHTPTTFLLLFLICCVKAPQKFLFLRSVFSSMKLNKIDHCHSCQIFISFSTSLLWESTTKWLWCLYCDKLQKTQIKSSEFPVFSRCLSLSPVCRRRLMETRRWWRCCGRTRGGRRPGAQSDHWFHWESDSCICCCCCRPAWAKTQTVTALRRLDWVISSITLMIQSRLQSAQLGFQYQIAATQLSWQAPLPPRSPELLMQLSHNTSFLIHYLCTTSLAGCFELDLHRAQRCPLQGLTHYRRSEIFPTLYSVFLLERWRSWYLYLIFWLYLILMAARFYLL